VTPRDALLELLCEPLPPGLAREARGRLEKAAAEEFSRAGVAFASLRAFATSRRLGLRAAGVPASAFKALPGLFSRALSGLDLPGSEAWEPSGFPFPRPVRGLLALHGERPAAFELAGLRAGRVTEGHEALGSRRLTVPSADRYFRALEQASVLADDEARLAAMRASLEAASRRIKLGVEAHEETLLEALYSCEYPCLVVSGFAHGFLALPPERLRAALRALRFFPVSDDDGRPQPYFAAFRDGVSKGQRNVEDGYRAALENALSRN